MTFADAINRLKVTVNRSDIEDQYLEFLNRAVREAANRFSWESMKKTATINVSSGGQILTLPSNFKELQNGRFPISEGGVPRPVYARHELERISSALRPANYFIVSKDDGTSRISYPAPVTGAKVLTVYHFAFPDTVTNTALSTPLLTQFENMILSKAAAIAFQAVNDPVYAAHDTQFEKELEANSGKDIGVRLPQPRPEKS